MRTALFGIAVAVAASAAPAAAAAVRLEAGGSTTLASRDPIDQVLIDVADVVRTEVVGPREIKVVGVQPGLTTITLVGGRTRSTYAVTVVEAGTAGAADLKRRLQEHADLAMLTVEQRDGKVVLSGSVPDMAAHARAVAIATAFGGKDITDAILVDGTPMVAVDIRFVAVSDTTLKSLGFNFSKLAGGFQAALVGPATLASYSFNSGGLNVTANPPLQNAFNLFLGDRSAGVLGVISALSDAGLSQILAQPTLLARSGERAEFLAGGEIPIPVPQAGSAAGAITIEYRQYGVRLSVEPYVMSGGRIVLKLAPEVSELDYANKVTIQGFSIPAFRRRSANTTVELGDGESFVIAGLTYSTGSLSESKVPLLGDVPLLGTLFRRTERSLEKLELVIVATPHLVTPLKESTVQAMLPTAIAPPSLGETIRNRNPLERRAALFGLSR